MSTKTLTTKRNSRKTSPKPLVKTQVEAPPVQVVRSMIVDAPISRLAAALHDRIQSHAEHAIELATAGDQPGAHLAIDDAIECARLSRRLGAFDSDGEYAECLYRLSDVRRGLEALS